MLLLDDLPRAPHRWCMYPALVHGSGVLSSSLVAVFNDICNARCKHIRGHERSLKLETALTFRCIPCFWCERGHRTARETTDPRRNDCEQDGKSRTTASCESRTEYCGLFRVGKFRAAKRGQPGGTVSWIRYPDGCRLTDKVIRPRRPVNRQRAALRESGRYSRAAKITE